MNDPTQVKAKITQIEPLTDSILQVMLTPENYIDYHAGQYLQIILKDENLNYSIANAPLGSKQYELHIRHHLKNPYTQALFAAIKQTGEVQLCLPFGVCHINQLHPTKPILFIAVGTGFAPIKAMIEHLLVSDNRRHFQLFWGARSQSDLYMDEKIIHWHKHAQHFRHYAMLTDPKIALSAAVLNAHQNLADWQVVINGPFDMVYDTRDQLLTAGVSADHLFSDAFSFGGTT